MTMSRTVICLALFLAQGASGEHRAAGDGSLPFGFSQQPAGDEAKLGLLEDSIQNFFGVNGTAVTGTTTPAASAQHTEAPLAERHPKMLALVKGSKQATEKATTTVAPSRQPSPPSTTSAVMTTPPPQPETNVTSSEPFNGTKTNNTMETNNTKAIPEKAVEALPMGKFALEDTVTTSQAPAKADIKTVENRTEILENEVTMLKKKLEADEEKMKKINQTAEKPEAPAQVVVVVPQTASVKTSGSAKVEVKTSVPEATSGKGSGAATVSVKAIVPETPPAKNSHAATTKVLVADAASAKTSGAPVASLKTSALVTTHHVPAKLLAAKSANMLRTNRRLQPEGSKNEAKENSHNDASNMQLQVSTSAPHQQSTSNMVVSKASENKTTNTHAHVLTSSAHQQSTSNAHISQAVESKSSGPHQRDVIKDLHPQMGTSSNVDSLAAHDKIAVLPQKRTEIGAAKEGEPVVVSTTPAPLELQPTSIATAKEVEPVVVSTTPQPLELQPTSVAADPVVATTSLVDAAPASLVTTEAPVAQTASSEPRETNWGWVKSMFFWCIGESTTTAPPSTSPVPSTQAPVDQHWETQDVERTQRMQKRDHLRVLHVGDEWERLEQEDEADETSVQHRDEAARIKAETPAAAHYLSKDEMAKREKLHVSNFWTALEQQDGAIEDSLSSSDSLGEYNQLTAIQDEKVNAAVHQMENEAPPVQNFLHHKHHDAKYTLTAIHDPWEKLEDVDARTEKAIHANPDLQMMQMPVEKLQEVHKIMK